MSLVELVDLAGTGQGSCPVEEAHRPPGQLHRAFSIMLFNDDGAMLLQQRAASKRRFPTLWSNTCCGHPAPGRDLVDSALTRLHEELGIVDVELREAGTFTYSAADPASGMTEREYDHVLVGRFSGLPTPDPNEAMSVRWRDPDELRAELASDAGSFTPWLPQVVELATDGGR